MQRTSLAVMTLIHARTHTFTDSGNFCFISYNRHNINFDYSYHSRPQHEAVIFLHRNVIAPRGNCRSKTIQLTPTIWLSI